MAGYLTSTSGLPGFLVTVQHGGVQVSFFLNTVCPRIFFFNFLVWLVGKESDTVFGNNLYIKLITL